MTDQITLSYVLLAACTVLLAAILVGLALQRLRARPAKAAGTGLAKTSALPLPGELTKALTPSDREFLPAALELLETPPSPVRVAGIWLICAAFTVSLAWSYFGRLDIHAIAQGRIQPSGRSKVVQTLEPGKVVAIAVENGSKVKVGDVLLELDPTETGADRDAQTRDLESARAESACRRVAIEVARERVTLLLPRPITFDATISSAVRHREESVLAGDLGQVRLSRLNLLAQLAEKSATRDKLTASTEAREKLIKLAKERVDMRTTLNDQGSLSRALVIEVLSQYENQITTQVSEKGQLIETEAAFRTVESKVAELLGQFISDQTGKLAEAERKADHLAQDLIKATAKSDRSTLKSPITGTVQQLAVSTVGQVVASGQSLMTIVPVDAPIEIEAMIQNQDIGFVNPGQDAVIKIDAFPFTRFGSINGKVQRVSRDAVEERDAQAMADPMTAARPGGAQAGAGQKGPSLVFPASIRLDHNVITVDGKDIPLSPGMTVTVEILTGSRRAIDYVLSPLREVTASTARER